jgi:hypothetical protein
MRADQQSANELFLGQLIGGEPVHNFFNFASEEYLIKDLDTCKSLV